MDYEKKYKEALEKAQRFYNNSVAITKKVLEDIFPELMENEDERVKSCISMILTDANETRFNDFHTTLADCLAWLKKQKPIQNINKEDEEVRQYIVRTMEQKDINVPMVQKALAWLEKQNSNVDNANKEYWRGYSEGKQAILDKYAELEKQGDVLNTRSQTIVSNMLEDRIDGLQRELIEFLSNTVNAPWKDIVKSADCYAQRITNMIKQGEQRPAEEYNITGIGSKNAQGKLGEMIKEMKSADKVEPKFKVEDWVVTSYGKVNQVIAVDEDGDGFTLDDDTYFSGSWKDGYHLWTIEDAKDGDVLYENDNNTVLIFKSQTCGWIKVYCDFWINKNKFTGTDHADYGKVSEMDLKPATKEQRDLLFQKMKEAGYEWLEETKELKKIEQKPAWSEEDERMRKDIIRVFKGEISFTSKKENEKYTAWLKSLRNRITWKPSEEQMNAFEQVYDWYNNNFAPSETLTSLYNDLKKLREE